MDKSLTKIYIPPAKLEKYISCIMIGGNQTEAEIYANVNHNRMDLYKKQNPSFEKAIERAKNRLNLAAKASIAKGIMEGDKDDAKWHLNKRHEDYKDKGNTLQLGIFQQIDGISVQISDEIGNVNLPPEEKQALPEGEIQEGEIEIDFSENEDEDEQDIWMDDDLLDALATKVYNDLNEAKKDVKVQRGQDLEI